MSYLNNISFSKEILRPVFERFSNSVLNMPEKKKKEIFSGLNDRIQTNYSHNEFNADDDLFTIVTQERIRLVSKHYQKKFNTTKQSEYDIKTYDFDKLGKFSELNALLNDDITRDKPKKIVFYNSLAGHASAALVTHDKKIIYINLSDADDYNKVNIERLLIKNNLDTEFQLLPSYYVKRHLGSYQTDNVSCVSMAFKHLKLLCANDGELFKKIKTLPSHKNIVLLPPEALRYSQSNNFLSEYIHFYARELKLNKSDKAEIIDILDQYRDINFDKLRILYHQVKHFSGHEKNKSDVIKNLEKLIR